MMARQLGCGQVPQGYSFRNSSNPERKSKKSCKPEESLNINVVQLFILGLLYQHQ
jgi:hypothetical protein